MADDMRPPSWKAFASSRLSSFKGYVKERDLKRALPVRRELRPGEIGYSDGAAKKQSWTQWAGQKLAKKAGDDVGGSLEKVNLFPGWASKQYHNEAPRADGDREGEPYDVEVFVSGYAVKTRAPGALSRSQRTFLRLAKSFASLPKLPDPNDPNDNSFEPPLPMSKSTEDLLATMELPPRPDEITEETEIRALLHSHNNSSTTLVKTSAESEPSHAPSPPLHLSIGALGTGLHSELQRLHMNLESRLNPFWAAALPSRQVRIFLHPIPGEDEDSRPSSSRSERAIVDAAIDAKVVTTTPEGAFEARFRIPWEALCTHPKGVHVAFGHADVEQQFLVRVELLPLPQPAASRPVTPSTPTGFGSPTVYTPAPPSPTAVLEDYLPLTHCTVRVISDIDDTVKNSGVITGARSVFHNVFVKDLKDSVIPGMGEWYGDMWRQGVRFHYVSNGPFELLPVINEFFQLAHLPPGERSRLHVRIVVSLTRHPAGSIRLRSYGTRSLFNGLLSAPATRKRAGVVDVLTSFPTSRFILIGDSGEQDLELYAALAREFYPRVLCVFIRDVNAYDDGGAGLQDPTGAWATSGAPGQEYVAAYMATRRKGSGALSIITPGARRSGRWSPRTGSAPASPTVPGSATPSARASRSFTGDYFSSRPVAETPALMDTLTAEPATYGPPSPTPSLSDSGSSSGSSKASQASLSESEKRRVGLQLRVWKARQEMPPRVVLRVFREPEECVEAGEALQEARQPMPQSGAQDAVLVDLS
ncbi:hypothetical protein FA95DRAFT_1009643 [Auriscalpium vulgare]|uniref:Uncharacterized protein n=1 Tax=Auriscalpium vulgare TaxID=40419 RepID=A0ACB8RX23_9AGAM|nr:hypothetical protein FA95DRAFT_1009643 [Auriscalpium vulgare]